MNSNNYIGITGITEPGEYRKLIDNLVHITLPESFVIAPGFLLHSSNSKIEKKSLFIDNDKLKELLKLTPLSWSPIIHICSYSNYYVEILLQRVLSKIDKQFNGFLQVNLPHDSFNQEIRQVAEKFEKFQFIQNVNLDKLQTTSKLPIDFERCINVIKRKLSNTRILFNSSSGYGQSYNEFQLDFLKYCFLKLNSENISIKFGIAGGLSSKNVYNLIKNIRAITGVKYFSVDAQMKLRGGKYQNTRVGNNVNPQKAIGYVLEVCRAFQ